MASVVIQWVLFFLVLLVKDEMLGALISSPRLLDQRHGSHHVSSACFLDLLLDGIDAEENQGEENHNADGYQGYHTLAESWSHSC